MDRRVKSTIVVTRLLILEICICTSLRDFRCESSLRHCNRLVSRTSRDANKEISRVGILKPTVRNGESIFRFHRISEREVQRIERK